MLLFKWVFAVCFAETLQPNRAIKHPDIEFTSPLFFLTVFQFGIKSILKFVRKVGVKPLICWRGGPYLLITRTMWRYLYIPKIMLRFILLQCFHVTIS